MKIPHRYCAVFTICLLVIHSAKGVTPCTISSSLRGSWSYWVSYDDVNYENRFNITLTSDVMLGYQLDQFTSLVYYCYHQSGWTISFRSEQTVFFNTYPVRIFFCWYLIKSNSETYYIVERTSPVMEDSEEHAKAYLEENSVPTSSAVCEFPYDDELYPPYRQIRKIPAVTWNT